MESYSYNKIDEGSDIAEASDSNFTQRNAYSPRTNSLIWKATSIFFFSTTVALCGYVYMFLWPSQGIKSATSSYELGLAGTEIKVPTNTISIEEVDFYGTPHVHQNGTGYRVQQPGLPTYVGPPNPSIDQAWKELIGDRYFWISEDEAKGIWPERYTEFFHHTHDDEEEPQWIVGVDLLHTLHCVNMLRKRLDQDYYPGEPSFGRIHLDHCIDQLRQYVMCAGDLTPIPTRWQSGAGKFYADSDQKHTCRKFGDLREWVSKQNTLRSGTSLGNKAMDAST